MEEKETRTHFGRKKKKIDDLVAIHTYEMRKIARGEFTPLPLGSPRSGSC